MVEGCWSIESRLAGNRISVGFPDSEMIILIPELFNPVNNVPIQSRNTHKRSFQEENEASGLSWFKNP